MKKHSPQKKSWFAYLGKNFRRIRTGADPYFRVKTFDELASDELTDVKKSKRRKKTKKVDSKFKKSTNSLLF